MARCTMCFQDRMNLAPARPGLPEVCRGCWLKIDAVLGYIELSSPLTLPPQTPPIASEPPENGPPKGKPAKSK
jgi:hypothetical protein